MASRGRRGGAPAREDEPRREERAEQQAPAPQGPVLPPPPPVDYGVFMQGLVQAMQTQAHTQAALQAQLEAQEGEMEQYLEEKKALQKRPATSFQRQDKKKAVYQTQQRSVAVDSTQVPSVRSPGVKKECLHCGKTHGGSPARSASPSSGSSSSASYRKTRKASSPSSSMKDYDAILGLDWLEEHYALVDCRASSGDPLQLEARVDQGEGFPDPSLLWRSTKNPEEWCFGDFLGLPKESFNDTFDPFGSFVRGK
ncbi:hypothetical protein Taro_018069 [Colocasia esculenta]|uniref:Uncharacterized protein n=1 Tax=Colocasia esculenta TaxID=4460 RepID=A0A843V1B3_COLES|nr:hypothetical protein [Colocasia esculenta]